MTGAETERFEPFSRNTTMDTIRFDAPKAHSFTAALCGFVGSTLATTMVLVLLSGI